MTKATFIRISDSEWEVMRVVWTKDKSDAAEIFKVLSGPMNWKMATIKTLLGRLVKKEALRTEQIGKKFIYYPNVQEEDVVRDAISDFMSKICATKMEQTLSDMIENVDLTQSDVLKLIHQLELKKTVKSVKCNCLSGQCHCQEHQVKEDV